MQDEIKREYKIGKTDLWYNVYRRKEEGWLLRVEWLQNWTYTLNRQFAKTFYNINDATSALVIARRKWDDTKETSEGTSESIQEKSIEKQSRSEF